MELLTYGLAVKLIVEVDEVPVKFLAALELVLFAIVKDRLCDLRDL